MSILHLKIIFSLPPFKTRISTLVKTISKSKWTTTLETNETNFVHKKESGAQVTTMPVTVYNKFKDKTDLKLTKSKLTACSGTKIPLMRM